MNWVGRGLVAVGGGLILAALWVKAYDSGYKLWDDGTYGGYYLGMVLLVVAFTAVAVVTRRRVFAFVAMVVALIICGDSLDTAVYLAFGNFHGTSVGFWLQPIGGLILASGALVAYLAHEGDLAAFPTEYPAGTPVGADRPAPPPPEQAPAPEVPAGWYPDPAGEARQRYWDGRQWTSQTTN
jgi:hypothetical protein